MLRKIKEDPNNWSDVVCSWMGRHDIVNVADLSKFIESMQSPSEIPEDVCVCVNEQADCKICMEMPK